MRVYVASSWRSERHPEVVAAIRDVGHDAYDFRHPTERDSGFHWSQIDPDWTLWTPEKLRMGLEHELAQHGFHVDMGALHWCEACVMVMPCGRSAHLELGWAAGHGKKTAIFLADDEPELMYLMADKLCINLSELLAWIDGLR